MKLVRVSFFGRGHENVLSTHITTFEVTKENTLSKRGDCIVAVGATIGAIDLPVEFKKAATKKNTTITITIEADTLKEKVKAKGSPKLSFTHLTDLVVRKSDYICGRTLAINADKASVDFSRELIEKLKNPKQKVKITLTAEIY
ncbi:DUF371 domain-containing protein [Candidatus Bathyarchaeota archaeon]|nr:DUF371 domain-containing protein [Candidatus Bathyarchaeota archaeon]